MRTLKVIRMLLILLALLFSGANIVVAAENLLFVRAGNIWIANIDGSGVRQITSSGQDRSPALSPDGKTIVYHSGWDEKTGYGNLYSVPTSGGSTKKLEFPGFQGAEHASFAPDGKNIVFIGLSKARKEGKGDSAMTYAMMSISVADLGRGQVRKIISTPNALLDTGYIYSNPSFSSDGLSIAYQEAGSDVSGGFSVISLAGKKLFHYPSRAWSSVPYWRPIFSLDGKQILCYSPATSESIKDAVYLVDIAKGTKRKITEGTSSAFIKGGKAIVFERWNDKWTEKARPDLWVLGLAPGATPQKIILDASQPAGNSFRTRDSH
jgi:Tol biopolymer transport system component